MKYLLILTSLLFISCGKKHYTQVIENRINDKDILDQLDRIKAQNLLNEAKLTLHDERLNEISQAINELKSEQVDLGTYLNFINTEYDRLEIVINNIENRVTSSENKIQLIKICNSKEYLIKVNELYYSVFMVSSNYGTFLGLLTFNLKYRTTDQSETEFKLTNGGIVCY